MLNYRLSYRDVISIIITLFLTFFFNFAFFMPKLMSLGPLLDLMSGRPGPPEIFNHPTVTTISYELWGFIFAVPAGALAIISARWISRPARISVAGALAAIILIFYAILTVFMRGKLPAPLLPTYLDVSAGLPGWIIGYFWAIGSEERKNFGAGSLVTFGATTVAVISIVVLVPLYSPFYVNTLSPLAPTVSATFHTIPVNRAKIATIPNGPNLASMLSLRPPPVQGVATLTPQPPASFNCSKASGIDEKLICSSAELRQADFDLSNAYQAALTASIDAAHQEDLRDDERRWVNERNKNCGVSEGTDIYDYATGSVAQGAYVDCFLVQYAGRIANLDRLIASPTTEPRGMALTEGPNSPFAWPPGPRFSYPPQPIQLAPGTVMQIFHIESNGARQNYTRFKRLTWLRNNELLIYATNWSSGATDLFLWSGSELHHLASFPSDSGFMDECFLPNGTSYYGPDGNKDPKFGMVSATGVFTELPSDPLDTCDADPNHVWGDDPLDPYMGPIQTNAGIYFYFGGLFRVTGSGPQEITDAIFSDAKVSPDGCLIAGYVGGYHQTGMSVLIGTHRANLQSGDVMIFNACASKI